MQHKVLALIHFIAFGVCLIVMGNQVHFWAGLSWFIVALLNFVSAVFNAVISMDDER